MNLRSFVRAVPDFPKPGIMFRDITPLIASPAALKEVTRQLAQPWLNTGITRVLAAEARGFIFGVPLAMELNAGFVPVRKPGKLPWQTRQFSYDLEYGSDALEIHTDAVQPGDRVLLVDDLLATGGTVEACRKLADELGATVVGAACVIELTFLQAPEDSVAKQISRANRRNISVVQTEQSRRLLSGFAVRLIRPGPQCGRPAGW